MLKNLDNRLNAEVLYALRAMGHGDTLVIADTNFPSDAIARQTVLGELLRMDNLTCAQAVEAVLSVLPLRALDALPPPARRRGPRDQPLQLHALRRRFRIHRGPGRTSDDGADPARSGHGLRLNPRPSCST